MELLPPGALELLPPDAFPCNYIGEDFARDPSSIVQGPDGSIWNCTLDGVPALGGVAARELGAAIRRRRRQLEVAGVPEATKGVLLQRGPANTRSALCGEAVHHTLDRGLKNKVQKTIAAIQPLLGKGERLGATQLAVLQRRVCASGGGLRSGRTISRLARRPAAARKRPSRDGNGGKVVSDAVKKYWRGGANGIRVRTRGGGGGG
jgi:hypothetical protein